LHALIAIEHPHVTLVFCGGTSLSKAHGLIERMSEDVDIKVALQPDHGLSASQLKKHLSKLKHSVMATMLESGFDAIDDESIALNENRYFASGWHFQSRYATHISLRPHLSLEFTVRTPLFDIAHKPIGYLIDQWSAHKPEHHEIACLAIEETLAEKVLSFLRRHAEHRAGVRSKWDTALVRHIYDVYCIVKSEPAVVEAAMPHFDSLVKYDRAEFPHHKSFVEEPKQCMAAALATAQHEPQTRQEYQQVLMPLIYGETKPSFDEAFDEFKVTARALLETL